MKRAALVLSVVIFTSLVLFACSKGYESRKTADDLNIMLSVDRYPLVKGDNTLNVKVEDSSGKLPADAAVNVRYYMPPMPGMAPMEFNTRAILRGERYSFSVNVPMEGGWKSEITVTRPGKPAATATFNLDAR
jgi:hypothetical protein